MNRTLIPIKSWNEIVAHIRPLAVMRLIAVGARHTRAAAHCFMLRIPRLVRMFLAHPAGVLAAVGHGPDMGSARERRYGTRIVSPPYRALQRS